MFRSFFVEQDGKKFDALENGVLSGAFFVSSVLKIFDLIKNAHGTVESTIKDLEESEWKNIKKPRIGSAIVWEKMDFDGDEHMHIGFYAGDNSAISHNYKKGYPTRHDWQFDGQRKITAIYWKNIK